MDFDMTAHSIPRTRADAKLRSTKISEHGLGRSDGQELAGLQRTQAFDFETGVY